jgi:O-antigen/teichoic acid export membrane protein
MRVAVALHQAATQWGRWLAAAAAVMLFGSNASAALIGAVAALVVLCATRLCALRNLPRLPMAGSSASGTRLVWQRRLQEYARPFAFWGLFTWALAASDRWALAMFHDRDSVGSYAVLYQLGFFPCMMLADALQQLIAPILFQRAGSGLDASQCRAVQKVNRRLLVLFGAGLVMLFFSTSLLHKPLVGCLAGSEFRDRSELLPWIVLAGGCFALGQLAALSIVSGASARALVPVKIGSAIVGIAMNFVGAIVYGIDGVVGAMVLSSAIYLFWTLWAARTPAEPSSPQAARAAP